MRAALAAVFESSFKSDSRSSTERLQGSFGPGGGGAGAPGFDGHADGRAQGRFGCGGAVHGGEGGGGLLVDPRTVLLES